MVPTDKDGPGKENDAESNEDLNYMESEDDSDEDVYDSDDNAEIYMEIVKDEDRYGEDDDIENNEDETRRW